MKRFKEPFVWGGLYIIISVVLFSVSFYGVKVIDFPHIPTVIVYEKEELPMPSVESYLETGILKVNINTASPQEIDNIPGIGEVISDNIVKYREVNGSFTSYDDLLKVDRIGEKTLQSIKNYIVFE